MSVEQAQATAPKHIPSALARGAIAVVLFGGTALVIAHDWLGVGGERFDFIAGGPLYDAVVIAASLACFLRAAAVPRERAAWIVIGIAIACWAAGEVYWTWEILDNPAPPYPSPADLGYLAFYPVAAVGLALLVRARARDLDWRLWTDGAIAALGTATLGAAFVVEFVGERTSGTDLQVATSLAYPLGDIAVLALVVGVVGLTGWRPDRTWSLLLAGLAAMAVADVAYTFNSIDGVVPAGNWIDALYLISAALLGAVLWSPVASPLETAKELGARREVIVPAIAGLTMVGLFLMHYFDSLSLFSIGLWSATMLAVVGRLITAVQENRRLLEQVQTDSLTGLPNRGRMQLDLERLCAEADTSNPIEFVFLDLDGFKHYNDTFGHPAGDELLARLAAALRGAIGEDGIAYRVGGDEFCAVLTCPPERFRSVEGRALAALTASGSGFQVSASWGAARLPQEAETPVEALRLADTRMYARKASHHLARGGDGLTLKQVRAGEGRN